MNHGWTVAYYETIHGSREYSCERERQLGPIDLTKQVIVRERIEMGEGLQIRLRRAARQRQCVAADAIEQSGRETLADTLLSGHQVLRHDRGGRAIVDPNILELR